MTPFQIWKRSVQLALTSTGNVAAGSLSFIASAHYWNPLPMILWGLGSVAWTLFASTSEKYTQRVLGENEARQEQERQSARECAIQALDHESHQRYDSLRAVQAKIHRAL